MEQLKFTATDKALIIKDTLAPQKGNAFTDIQKARFLRECELYGLHPLRGQILPVLRWSNPANACVMAIQVSIDGYRALAVAAGEGEYEGQVGPFWCGKDGEWKDVWIPSKEEPLPHAAKVGVWRKGFREPAWGLAIWKAYGKTDNFWRNGPDHMLAKCAESLALRKAFPTLGGLITEEEMGSAAADTILGVEEPVEPEEGTGPLVAEWVSQIEDARTLEELAEVGERLKKADLHPDITSQLKGPFVARRDWLSA